jgi:hypothetical protein
MDRREWLDHLWQFTDGTVYLPDIRTYSLQVKVLQDIGLFDAIDLDNPEQEYSQEGEAIQQLLKRARRRSKAIYTAFHLKVTSKSKPIQFVNRLLGRVGLRLKFHRQIAKGERFYRIDLQQLNDPDRIAVLDSLTQKWEQGSSQPPQQQPVEINNTGHCCDLSEIPEECRTDVLAVGAWLAEAARETPETLPAILDLAVEYLRAVPQAKTWLWQGMEAWVKETIGQLFPDYYRALASP